MHSTYHGSTLTELRKYGSPRRWFGLVDPALRLAHHGRITLVDGRLTLSDWCELTPTEIASVTQEYLPEFGPLSAAGSRGGFPSLAFLQPRGKPIVLRLNTGEVIVLLVGRRRLTGLNDNAVWTDALQEFVAA